MLSGFIRDNTKNLIIESFILGDARRVEFTEGYPWDKGEVKIESEKVDEETIKKLKEKINESENKNSKGNNQ